MAKVAPTVFYLSTWPTAGPELVPQPANSTASQGFTLNMLRDKIRELEGRPGGSPKIKELLRKLKVAVDGPQGRQSTAMVYRVVHLVVHYFLLILDKHLT